MRHCVSLDNDFAYTSNPDPVFEAYARYEAANSGDLSISIDFFSSVVTVDWGRFPDAAHISKAMETEAARESRKYDKRYSKDKKKQYKCQECGKTYTPLYGATARYCSKPCKDRNMSPKYKGMTVSEMSRKSGVGVRTIQIRLKNGETFSQAMRPTGSNKADY